MSESMRQGYFPFYFELMNQEAGESHQRGAKPTNKLIGEYTMNNSDYPTIADGKHIGRITEVIREESIDGHPKYKLNIQLAEPSQGVTDVVKVYKLSTPNSIKFMQKELETMGVSGVQSRADMDRVRHELIGKTISFTAKTAEDGWQSYYIQGVIAEGSHKEDPGVW